MIATWQRYSREHPRAADAAVAVLLFVICVPGTLLTSGMHHGHLRWWPAALLLAVSCTALMWQRSHPRAVVVATTLCSLAACTQGYLLTPLLFAPLMVALYRLTLESSRRTAFSYASAIAVLLATSAVIADPVGSMFVLNTLNPIGMVLLPAVLGNAVQSRKAYLGAVAARVADAERTREEEARRRVSEERMRIARELHDVVAHHLALANAQAGTVAHLVRTRPEQAEKLLAELAGTTSSALRELKATVGLLRQTDDARPPLEPAPGLDRLPELAEAMRVAGLTVTLVTEGTPQPLSPGVDLTAFRIIQEALTNVSKHAGSGRAEVKLVHYRDRLAVTVSNEAGRSRPKSSAAGSDRSSGYGLLGMRERAQSLGGLLRAGPSPSGGFEVATELPLHPRDPEDDPDV